MCALPLDYIRRSRWDTDSLQIFSMASQDPFAGKKKTLIMLLVLSLLFHFFVVLNFGGYRLFMDEVWGGNRTVEMPAIMQMRQLNEEYTVNLEKGAEAHTVIREVPLKLAIQTELKVGEESGSSVAGAVNPYVIPEVFQGH